MKKFTLMAENNTTKVAKDGANTAVTDSEAPKGAPERPTDAKASSAAAEPVEKKKECPFLATETKKCSPFLASKPAAEKHKAAAGDVKDVAEESEITQTTTKAQHSEIDSIIKDKCIFNTVAKLYFVAKRSGNLETRGEGKFAIIKDASGLYKILMIRNVVMLKGCNHYIAGSCPLIKVTQSPKSWTWIALNDKSDAEVNEPKTTYFVTFKTEDDSELFAKKYEEAKQANIETLAKLKGAEAGKARS